MASILRILACFILTVSSYISYAQTFTWASLVADSTVTPMSPMPVAVATDHHYHTIVTGYYQETMRIGSFLLTANGYYNDGYLAKYDSTGNVIWAIDVAGYGIYPYAIVVDGNDNIYLSGYFDNKINFTATDSLVSIPGESSFLAKYDSNGKFQWARTDQSYGTAYSVTVDPYNNIIWAGYYMDSANFEGIKPVKTASAANAFIAKYTSSGSLIWLKTNTPVSYNAMMYMYGLSTDRLGNIYATGYVSGGVTFDTVTLQDTANTKEAFIAKFDSSGTMLWGIPEQNNPTKNGQGNEGNSIGVDRNGNAYICGYFYDTSNLAIEGFVEKYATSGAKQWTVNLGNGSTAANGISLDANGYPYIIGNYSNSITIGGTTLSSYSDNAFIAKLDTIGSLLWAQSSYGWAYGLGLSIDQNAGNISILGKVVSSTKFGTFSIKSTFSKYPSAYIAYLSNPIKPIYTNVETVNNIASAIIYPNPATNQLFIKHAALNTAVKLFNISGQAIYNTTVSSDNQPVNISGLANGIYLLQLTGLDGNKQTARIVKE